ncbi:MULTISPECIES: site-specific integrase [unclassified Granulicatella]|uniref:site-specific integrase n=1 Tax=unclassified Granulicatella TaxID=2630493 RepID=UPI001072F27A|nr:MULTISPECIES: site-specific integrase [unclassified Granulicatella]MBF0780371.1 site-specific integrase [Granulicatella sp. 19428wC4_WM01]TFU95503.1 site-specific integrase [Granulicatella sp. WM01]
MVRNRKNQLFSEYFSEWIELYKEGAVRQVTLNKYYVTQQYIEKLAPFVRIGELNRRIYQKLLNDYAQTHERQTTMDFHHQLKSAILDAVEDGLLKENPTRKVIIKGKVPAKKRPKFLNHGDVQLLIKQLNLGTELNWDWFILLIIKTGLRFSEALAITPDDFDFNAQKLTINKTWNYKSTCGGFQLTKNESSNRKIQLDWQTAFQFSQLIRGKNENRPIFVSKRVFNSTINNHLQQLCERAGIPQISIHGLRHTHASLLLFADVSIASVAKRLGHSNISTTQETYIHIIKELENQDGDKIMKHLATLV